MFEVVCYDGLSAPRSFMQGQKPGPRAHWGRHSAAQATQGNDDDESFRNGIQIITDQWNPWHTNGIKGQTFEASVETWTSRNTIEITSTECFTVSNVNSLLLVPLQPDLSLMCLVFRIPSNPFWHKAGNLFNMKIVSSCFIRVEHAATILLYFQYQTKIKFH